LTAPFFAQGAAESRYEMLMLMAFQTIGIFLGGVAFRGTAVMARTEYLEGQLLGELLERDPLTGLKNRRSFDAHLERSWLQAQRDGRAGGGNLRKLELRNRARLWHRAL
jgi:hypothetical protein